MGDLFDQYPVSDAAKSGGKQVAFDEMFAAGGKPRPSYRKIHEALAKMTPNETAMAICQKVYAGPFSGELFVKVEITKEA